MDNHVKELENIIERMLQDYEIVTGHKIEFMAHHIAEIETKRSHLVCIKVEK